MEAHEEASAAQQPIGDEIQVGKELSLLIEEFEQFVSERTRVPLTGKLMVDEEDLYGFIDHLRQLIPKEIRRALDVMAQRDRILEQAEAQAETIIAEARQYSQRLTDESAIIKRAREEAARLLAEAHEAAQALRRDADQYAERALERLETILGRAIRQVQEGRRYLQEPPQETDQEAVQAEEGEDPGE